MMGTGLTIEAPAKVNWTLRVLARRDDGYHEIESLVSKLSLADELALQPRADGDLGLSCDAPGVPTGPENLVLRAAEALRRQAGALRGVSCRLTKRIPVGGGLGGGSSDAAAALVALNALWGLGLTEAQLTRIGACVGSDVALFLTPGSVVMRGRGELVAPVPTPWSGWVVLLMPGLQVPTARVYGAWRPGCGPEDMPAVPEPCRDAREWMSRTYNMLEEPAFRLWPILAELQRSAEALAGRPVRMSGSGSTFMTAFDDPQEAGRFAARAAEALNVRTQVSRVVEGRLAVRNAA